jgi:hypothetical protein
MNAKQRRKHKKQFLTDMVAELKANFTAEQLNTDLIDEMLKMQKRIDQLENENDEFRKKLKLFPFDEDYHDA